MPPQVLLLLLLLRLLPLLQLLQLLRMLRMLQMLHLLQLRLRWRPSLCPLAGCRLVAVVVIVAI